MRPNLTWLISLWLLAAVAMSAARWVADFWDPGPARPFWEYRGVRLGGPPLPPEPEQWGFCGNMVDQFTGFCKSGDWQDRDQLHLRLHSQRIVLLRAPEFLSGNIRITEGLSRAQILAILGQPTHEINDYRQVLVYDEDRCLLAFLLEGDRTVSLQAIRKFKCDRCAGGCAYYWGWWQDYLATEAMECPTSEVAWPWHRSP